MAGAEKGAQIASANLFQTCKNLAFFLNPNTNDNFLAAAQIFMNRAGSLLDYGLGERVGELETGEGVPAKRAA